MRDLGHWEAHSRPRDKRLIQSEEIFRDCNHEVPFASDADRPKPLRSSPCNIGNVDFDGIDFIDRRRVKQPTLVVERLELQLPTVDGDKAVVVAVFNGVLKSGLYRPGRFQPPAGAAGDHVDRSVALDHFSLAHGPSAFVGMDVAVPEDVNPVTVVKFA